MGYTLRRYCAALPEYGGFFQKKEFAMKTHSVIMSVIVILVFVLSPYPRNFVLAHGVTQHESSLLTYYQSDVTNEPFSDLRGEFVDLTMAPVTTRRRCAGC
ncbi:MAG: hypothetical protein IPF85_21885 [Anaerolineae bacterium]|nr:hypothetical protein [Anaerolineae bacterium]